MNENRKIRDSPIMRTDVLYHHVNSFKTVAHIIRVEIQKIYADGQTDGRTLPTPFYKVIGEDLIHPLPDRFRYQVGIHRSRCE